MTRSSSTTRGQATSNIHKRMTQGDPEALAIYHDFQDTGPSRDRRAADG
jgi:hypothetical protein